MRRKLLDFNLNFDREIVGITIISTLLLIIDRYHNFTGIKALDRAFIFLLIPLGIIILAERKSPTVYGFQIGDWKAGLKITSLVILISIPILFFATRGNLQIQQYYGNQLSPITPLITFLDYIGWEFFFRGWILFGYARVFGDNALWLQAVPFAFGHLGKPEVETLSTIFGGFLFGWVAWRTKSFIYPFLIHFFIGLFTIYIAASSL